MKNTGHQGRILLRFFGTMVRQRLGLQAGDKLDVAVEGRRIVLIPKTLHLSDVCSLLPAPETPVSIKEMNEAIVRGALGE